MGQVLHQAGDDQGPQFHGEGLTGPETLVSLIPRSLYLWSCSLMGWREAGLCGDHYPNTIGTGCGTRAMAENHENEQSRIKNTKSPY